MRSAIEAATGRTVRSLTPVRGGDINVAYKVQFGDESFGFVKTRAGVQPGEYVAEAAGLRWLAEPGALRVPKVLGVSDEVLVLDWVDEGTRGDGAAFGAGLAAVHAAGADDWGTTPPEVRGDAAPSPGRIAGRPPLRIGPLRVPNDPCPDWPTFYAERRLRPLLARAGLSARGLRAVESVCDRIAELAGPPEPPARLHGDLWSGNVHWDRRGRAWLIDPAAHGGHREVDLAMLTLFGDPGRQFFAAYEDRHPLAPGWQERVPLYQLFPLLVHAALFGGGYAASVERAASAYV
ncbi:fructosamine kinase family protein [Solirubrobacter sp. CPCC 204708]|uniref:Fructosamine kinase family protein n=1 Tax=Solirubrobacter deserti TaxID=2282478 RepID=A0ABT4RLJ4_9ACTN|nr:fructosamine kinase family protein [Solirubrobacter deserti]MBE2319128.1 fructosamine kinase family protein [Solirubrobacter deserti]MDA0139206.1 fructosamine kinase family protein [Solirubrobacter deserti]